MATEIISKTCTKCKQTKRLNEFYKNINMKDNYLNQCKICVKKRVCIYSKTEKAKTLSKISHKRYERTEKGKRVVNRRCKKFRQSKKGRRYYSAYRKNNPKIKAADAVNHAVSAGKLPHISTRVCFCGKSAQQYHHYKGYAPKHWLDVIPMCILCHQAAHFRLLL